jgi:hypothetical protein
MFNSNHLKNQIWLHFHYKKRNGSHKKIVYKKHNTARRPISGFFLVNRTHLVPWWPKDLKPLRIQLLIREDMRPTPRKSVAMAHSGERRVKNVRKIIYIQTVYLHFRKINYKIHSSFFKLFLCIHGINTPTLTLRYISINGTQRECAMGQRAGFLATAQKHMKMIYKLTKLFKGIARLKSVYVWTLHLSL